MKKDLLSILDVSVSEMDRLFRLSDELEGSKKKPLEGKALALLFEKASTRTRVSFESAMLRLGGHSIYLESKTMQMSRGETLGDTAKVLSSYVDIIAARMYKQSDLEELGKAASIPVINALTDLEHPCQALSDVYTIRQLMDPRGRKLAFVGDIAANTANSLMVAAAMAGMEVNLVGPKNCKPNMEYVKAAGKHADVSIFSNQKEGLDGADVVYTDTFISMGQEEEAGKRRKLFKDYQVNRKLMSYAGEKAVVMHCLPAHRGEEISAEVLDGRQSVVWQQARNKMAVEKAILLALSNQA